MVLSEPLALTAAQRGIWLGQQLDARNPAYWTAEAVELEGALDEGAFERAVHYVIDATEALHTRYYLDGTALFQSVRAERHWALEKRDLSASEAPAQALAAWMDKDLASRPDLENGTLFFTALLRMRPRRHIWYLRVHHVALDGYGYQLLMRQVGKVYGALCAQEPLPGRPQPALRALVEEDRKYRSSPAFERDRDFWLARLAEAPPPALLRPTAPLAHTVLRERVALSAEVWSDWKQMAGNAGVDWSAWLIAAVAAFMGRETQARELIFGLPVTGRLGSVALSVPCMAMNIIPLRICVEGAATLQELARQTAAEVRALRTHQRYRYEDLRHDLGLYGEGRRLFGPVINLMPFEAPVRFGELEVATRSISAGPVEDLAVGFASRQHSRELQLEANPHAYVREDLSAYRERLLESLLAARPDLRLREVPRAPSPSRVSRLSGEALASFPADVLDKIQAAAVLSPDKVAIEQEGTSHLTYAELIAAVSALAVQLEAAGVGAQSRVALLLPRCPLAIVAQLAVLWLGAAYIPLDPAGPAARNAFVLDDAQPTLVIALREMARALGEVGAVLYLDDAPSASPNRDTKPRPVSADSLAYGIYTSGSTGRPNGAMISRGALNHFVAAAQAVYGMTAADRVLQFAPLQFDASVEEIMVCLASGATLVLRTDAMLESFPTFLAICERLAVSVLDLPTAFWHELAFALGPDLNIPSGVRLTILGGEAALQERIERWRSWVSPQVILLNTYGPTETTVVCCTAELAGLAPVSLEGGVPIGRPVPGTTLLVVDQDLNPVPVGTPGELCVLGPTLAQGYLGRADLTATRFVQLAHEAGQRVYRTGDRVVLCEDGELRYLGRLDDELKISGIRVNPAEVESALLSLEGIVQAVVVCQQPQPGEKRLIAFLVADEQAPSDDQLRSELQRLVSPAAVPSTFSRLETIPRDSNGKVDRKLLGALVLEPTQLPHTTATPLEQLVMSVWSDVLGRPVVRPDTDFFAVGGRSLQALQVAHRLGRLLNCEVPVSALFRHSSVSALTKVLSSASHPATPLVGQNPLSPLVALQAGSGRPLFCIHPADGLSWCYMGLTRHLNDVPIYALQAPGLTGASSVSFERLVANYLELVRSVQPTGPYRFLGWSSGGGISHALAAALQARGESVTLVAMLDSYPASVFRDMPQPTERDALIAMLDEPDASRMASRGDAVTRDELLALLQKPTCSLSGFDVETLARMAQVALDAMRTYRLAEHPVFHGNVLFFRAQQRPSEAPEYFTWRPYVNGDLIRVDVDAPHLGMCQPDALATICRTLQDHLAHS